MDSSINDAPWGGVCGGVFGGVRSPLPDLGRLALTATLHIKTKE